MTDGLGYPGVSDGSVRLLSFLVVAAKARRVVAFGPEPEAAAALASAVAAGGGTLSVADAAGSALPAGADEATSVPRRTDLVYLGPGAELTVLPPGALVVTSDPRTVAAAIREEVVLADVPLAPSKSAPRITLAMAGAVPEAVESALSAIREADRSRAPTEPVDELTGRLLYLLVRARRSARVLELGTSAGAAALWLASALDRTGGRLTTVERDSARRNMAEKHIRWAGLLGRAELYLGEALRVVPTLHGSYDLVFLDEEAQDRVDDLEALLPRCASRALVISRGTAAGAVALAPFNAHLRTLPRVRAAASLAVGQGLMLAVLD